MKKEFQYSRSDYQNLIVPVKVDRIEFVASCMESGEFSFYFHDETSGKVLKGGSTAILYLCKCLHKYNMCVLPQNTAGLSAVFSVR